MAGCMRQKSTSRWGSAGMYSKHLECLDLECKPCCSCYSKEELCSPQDQDAAKSHQQSCATSASPAVPGLLSGEVLPATALVVQLCFLAAVQQQPPLLLTSPSESPAWRPPLQPLLLLLLLPAALPVHLWVGRTRHRSVTFGVQHMSNGSSRSSILMCSSSHAGAHCSSLGQQGPGMDRAQQQQQHLSIYNRHESPSNTNYLLSFMKDAIKQRCL